MFRNLKTKRSLQVMVMVIAVLLVGITANGYADPLGPNERLSGPALVGTLTLAQTGLDGTDTFVFFSGKCRGVVGDDGGFPLVLTLSGFTVDAGTTATSLEGVLRLPDAGPFGCLFKDASGGDLIVNTVVAPKFVNTGTVITADVVLLYVVPR